MVGPGGGAPRLVAVPFLAAADLPAPLRLVPPERRALFPFGPVDPVDPPRVPDPAPRPPLPRPPAAVPALRLPDRAAVVRAPDPVPRPAPPPAEPVRAPPDRADPPDRAVPPEPRRAPRGGVLGKITSGDSSLW